MAIAVQATHQEQGDDLGRAADGHEPADHRAAVAEDVEARPYGIPGEADVGAIGADDAALGAEVVIKRKAETCRFCAVPKPNAKPRSDFALMVGVLHLGRAE